MPADESIGLDNDEGAPPVEEPSENDHEQLRRVDCAARLDPALLVQGQLFAETKTSQECTLRKLPNFEPNQGRSAVTDEIDFSSLLSSPVSSPCLASRLRLPLAGVRAAPEAAPLQSAYHYI